MNGEQWSGSPFVLNNGCNHREEYRELKEFPLVSSRFHHGAESGGNADARNPEFVAGALVNSSTPPAG